MRGRVMRRGKTWSHVVSLGRDAQGRKRQKWKGGVPTKRAAEDALTEVLERIRTGNYIDAGRTTVGEFLVGWLAATTPRIRPSTASRYTDVLTHWVMPRIRHVRLSQLGPLHISELHESLATSGRRDGRGGLSSVSGIAGTAWNLSSARHGGGRCVANSRAGDLDAGQLAVFHRAPYRSALGGTPGRGSAS